MIKSFVLYFMNENPVLEIFLNFSIIIILFNSPSFYKTKINIGNRPVINSVYFVKKI